jgi:hypothetical protein
MLPVADSGLDEIGVDAEERKLLLGLIADRLDAKRTPAGWQRDVVKSLGDVPRDEALKELVEAYLGKVATRRPVTEW